MRGVSGGSLAEVLDAVERSTGTLSTVGDELFLVAAMLDATPSIRRVLTDPATEPDARSGLAAAVLSDKVDVATLGIVDVAAQHREQAQVEAERITSNAQAQLEIERTQALNQLKGEVGAIATSLAGRIVGESLEDDKRQKRSVERFIAELEDEGKSKKSGNAKSKN